MNTPRASREIEHGKKLAQGDANLIWGWSTPAGKLRATRRAKLITHGADLKPGMRVLEIGCGTGNFTEMFAESGAFIVAVDISSELLEIAKQRNLPENQVLFLNKRFEDCDLIGPFDAVIGSSVLHHLDIKPALNKIRELLKPGGRMCFAEPNMMNPQVMVQKTIPWVKERLGDSPDETAFFRWQLKKLLLEAGFRDIVISPFDWLHPLSPPSLIKTITSIGNALEKTPILREIAGSLYIRCNCPSS